MYQPWQSLVRLTGGCCLGTLHPVNGRINVEAAVDQCVRLAGGNRVTEICGDSPNFENADYFFSNDDVVAELKVLEHDMGGLEFEEKVSALYTRWSDEGKVPPGYGRVRIDTANLPEDCAREFFGLLKRKLEVPLKKANKQLRETKTNLKRLDAVGLLLLVNDGNYILDPGVTFHLVYHALNGQYTNIDCVIFFNVNLTVAMPGVPTEQRLWARIKMDGRRSLSDAFSARLAEAWHTVLEQKLGISLPRLECADPNPESVHWIRNIK